MVPKTTILPIKFPKANVKYNEAYIIKPSARVSLIIMLFKVFKLMFQEL